MLEARDLGFSYGRRVVLERVNVTFETDARTAIVAPSGTGKTTLCRLLAGYERPGMGEVLLDGVPLLARGVCPVQLIGQNPGGVFDERRRLGDSLAEADGSLVHWRAMTTFGGRGSDEAPEAVRALLKAVGIRPVWLHRFPHELSGGELQRFAIARALLARPRFVIADEITTMLDAVSTARLWGVIGEYLKVERAGLIFVSHDPALIDRLATTQLHLTPR